MTIHTQINRILQYFQRPQKTAQLAKERLQIIIAHEKKENHKPDYLASLQKDLLDVIGKYVKINKEDVNIEVEHQAGCSILELNVMLPALKGDKSLTK